MNVTPSAVHRSISMPSQSYASRSFWYFLYHKPFCSATSNSKSYHDLAHNIWAVKQCTFFNLGKNGAQDEVNNVLAWLHVMPIRISNLQMSPGYAASKGQCIGFIWACTRNAFCKFLPRQQQNQQIMINLPLKQLKLHQKDFFEVTSPIWIIDLVTWDWCLRFSLKLLKTSKKNKSQPDHLL